MKVTIEFRDAPTPDNPNRMVYRIRCQTEPGDQGITSAAYLAHSLAETFKHIAQPDPATLH